MAKFCKGCGKELGFFTKKIKVPTDEDVFYFCQSCFQDLKDLDMKNSQRELAKRSQSKKVKISNIDKVQNESVENSGLDPVVSSDCGDGLFLVRLTDVGHLKINVIKVIRQITGLDLRESKDIADNLSTVISNLNGEQAREVAAKLNSAGAKTEIVDQ